MLDNALIRLFFTTAIAFGFMTALLAVLPSAETYPYPDIVSTALLWLIDNLYTFDFILPIGLIFWLFGTVLLAEMTFFMIRFFVWLYNLVLNKQV